MEITTGFGATAAFDRRLARMFGENFPIAAASAFFSGHALLAEDRTCPVNTVYALAPTHYRSNEYRVVSFPTWFRRRHTKRGGTVLIPNGVAAHPQDVCESRLDEGGEPRLFAKLRPMHRSCHYQHKPAFAAVRFDLIDFQDYGGSAGLLTEAVAFSCDLKAAGISERLGTAFDTAYQLEIL